MTARSLRKALSLWLIGVLLLAQSAVASYACPGMGSEMASAAAMIEVDGDAANLCVEHCRFGQQSADHTPSPLLAPAILTPLYSLPPAVTAAVRPLAAVAPPAAVDPPHAILHCCLRT